MNNDWREKISDDKQTHTDFLILHFYIGGKKSKKLNTKRGPKLDRQIKLKKKMSIKRGWYRWNSITTTTLKILISNWARRSNVIAVTNMLTC